MAIKVAPGAGDLAAELAGAFVLQVTGCSDEDAAARALADARGPIAALAGPPPAPGMGPSLSNPLLAPGGVILRVTQLDVDADLAATVPDIVVAALERAGVTRAVVDVLDPRGPLDDLDLCRNAVVLRVFPIPAGEDGVIPPAWVELAAEWVLGELGPDEEVPMRLLGAPFDVLVADAPAVLHHAARAWAWCDLVHGDPGDRIRTASLTFGRTPHLAVGAGGPGCDEDALLARFELLCEAARELRGEVAYACVDLEPDFGGLGAGISDDGWRAQGGAAPNVVAGEVVDQCVPDAFPYQVLGPRHMARLRDGAATSPAQTAPAGEHLEDGRTGLALGDPSDWLPDRDHRADAQAAGWDALAPLLLRPAELDDLLAERPERPRSLHVGAAAAAAGGQIDLDAVVLEPTPHARRGLHLTLLELVAWLAHEHHTDNPATVSPVVAAFARWFSSSLEPNLRQQLKRRARALIGTAGHSRRRDDPMSPEDVARTWLATDWLIRAQAPTWLRAAGHLVAADRLAHLDPTDDPTVLYEAVEILADVLATTERPDRSGGHRADPSLAPRLVWDAWEHASEAGGWVAASEAAGIGLPEDLAYAVELKVIEGTRDERVRTQLAHDGASLVDHVRASAWSALAVTAWGNGWEALEEAVDDSARVSFDTAIDRARRGVIGRDGVDLDTYDLSVEAAESAAREMLADRARRSRQSSDELSAWAAALEAGRAAPGAAPWAEVIDLTHDVVEDGPWTAGNEAASAAVDAVLDTAPNLVDRAVGAAFAREASGFAAREVALLAAGAALREGATEAEAAVRIRTALAPIVDALRDASLGLLDALIEGGEPFDDEPGTANAGESFDDGWSEGWSDDAAQTEDDPDLASEQMG